MAAGDGRIIGTSSGQYRAIRSAGDRRIIQTAAATGGAMPSPLALLTCGLGTVAGLAVLVGVIYGG